MALIECPEYGRQVSSVAYSCPGCGYSINERKEVKKKKHPKDKASERCRHSVSSIWRTPKSVGCCNHCRMGNQRGNRKGETDSTPDRLLSHRGKGEPRSRPLQWKPLWFRQRGHHRRTIIWAIVKRILQRADRRVLYPDCLCCVAICSFSIQDTECCQDDSSRHQGYDKQRRTENG